MSAPQTSRCCSTGSTPPCILSAICAHCGKYGRDKFDDKSCSNGFALRRDAGDHSLCSGGPFSEHAELEKILNGLSSRNDHIWVVCLAIYSLTVLDSKASNSKSVYGHFVTIYGPTSTGGNRNIAGLTDSVTVGTLAQDILSVDGNRADYDDKRKQYVKNFFGLYMSKPGYYVTESRAMTAAGKSFKQYWSSALGMLRRPMPN